MSIGDVKGPYTSYFFVGTQEQIEARRAYYKPSQPLGRDIEPGEQDEMFIESVVSLLAWLQCLPNPLLMC